MNYFTPELYLRFNSPDEDEAGRADADWDGAEAAYRDRLAAIRPRMPSTVLALSELCLHDTLVASRVELSQPAGEGRPLWTAVAIISVTAGEEVVSLIYSLSDHVTTREAPAGWRFSREQEQWLYDEVDVGGDARGPFVHRILLSSGVTLEIPFVSVIVHRFQVPSEARAARQSA